jgi:hypothetical protein
MWWTTWGISCIWCSAGLDPDDWKPMANNRHRCQGNSRQGRIGHFSPGLSGYTTRSGLRVALLSKENAANWIARYAPCPATIKGLTKMTKKRVRSVFHDLYPKDRAAEMKWAHYCCLA